MKLITLVMYFIFLSTGGQLFKATSFKNTANIFFVFRLNARGDETEIARGKTNYIHTVKPALKFKSKVITRIKQNETKEKGKG